MKARIPKFDIESYIYEQYEDFKRFIGFSNLPDFEIQEFDIFKSKGTAVAILTPPQFDGDIYKLEIAKNAKSVYKDGFRSILFHEFTHIWDGTKYASKIYGEDRNKLIEFYSEVHASQVKLMALMGFENINHNKKVKLSDEIILSGELSTFELFLLTHKTEILNYIFEAANKPSEKIIERALKHIMYYYGFVSFCKQYSDDKLENLEDFTIFQSFFGDKIIEAFEIVRNTSKTEINEIKELQEIRKYVKGLACYRLIK